MSILDIIVAAGSGVAYPSQTLYVTRDKPHDPSPGRAGGRPGPAARWTPFPSRRDRTCRNAGLQPFAAMQRPAISSSLVSAASKSNSSMALFSASSAGLLDHDPTALS